MKHARRFAWLATTLVRLTRRFATRTVAVSDAVRDELVAAENVAPGHLVVIENGVDTDRFRPATPVEIASAV